MLQVLKNITEIMLSRIVAELFSRLIFVRKNMHDIQLSRIFIGCCSADTANFRRLFVCSVFAVKCLRNEHRVIFSTSGWFDVQGAEKK